MKFGYVVVRSKKVMVSSSFSSSHQLPPLFWKGLWKVLALSRCKDLIWRGCLKILLVREALRARGVEVDELCPFLWWWFGNYGHVLLFCPMTRSWWFATPLSLRLWGWVGVPCVRSEADSEAWCWECGEALGSAMWFGKRGTTWCFFVGSAMLFEDLAPDVAHLSWFCALYLAVSLKRNGFVCDL